MPRLPTRGEPADCILRFRVTRREYALLTTHACASSITVSQLIAEAVAEFTGDLTDHDDQAPHANPTPRR